MRRGKESDDVDDDEKKRQEECEEERKSTGGSELDDGIKFGEQLQDDLINTFCDKLQKACPRTLDAFMAIQFLIITDEKDIRRMVTGTNPALQVLYDRTRSHYVLVYYSSKYKKVFLFDSLQPYDRDETPQILNELVFYISRLFGHLFTKHIPVIVDKEFQRQSDNFSCGYRVIGALVDVARGRNPCTQDYSRTEILNFLRFILAEPEPTWEMFESADFACKKEYTGQQRVSIYITNTTYVGTPSTSRSSSQSTGGKRSSSEDSLASQKSEHSSNGGRGRKTGRRAHAGYYNPHLENYRANSERYTRSIPPPPRNLYPYRPSSPLSAPYFQAPPTALGLPPPPVDNTLITRVCNSTLSIFNTLSFRRKSDHRFEGLEDDVEKGLGVEKRDEE